MRKYAKMLAVLLSVVMLVGVLTPMTALATSVYTPQGDFYKISETERAIAPGIKENRLIVNKASGNQQEVVYAVSIDAAAKSTTALMAGYADYNGNRWKLQTVRQQAAAATRATGANIVAAVNADIFNMQTGEPTGCLVMGGTVYKRALGRPYFGVTNNGDYVIGESLTSKVLATLREGVSGFYMIVKDGNRYGPGSYIDPETGEPLEHNAAPKTAIGLKADGSIVVVAIDGRNAPISCNIGDYDLATIMLDLGCVDVLNFDGGGSTTYLAKYEGNTSLELVNRPSDGVERSVASSLFIVSTARPSGEFDHASLSPNNELYTPGSTVSFTAIGVDSAGESAPLPADGSFALAADSAALGTITPDGVFTAGDATGVVTVNYVSGGAVVGTTAIEIAEPDELYIPGEEYSLDFDEQTDFGIVAKNAGRTINIKDGDLVWEGVPTPGEGTKFVIDGYPAIYTGGSFLYNVEAQTFSGNARERFKGSNVRTSFTTSETFTGDGATTEFTIADNPSALKTVTVDGATLTSGTDYTYLEKTNPLTFMTAPAEGAEIVVTYTSYNYAVPLAGMPAAEDLYSVTCDGYDITDYAYDAATGTITFVSARNAGSNKVIAYYYTRACAVGDLPPVFTVSVDGAAVTEGFTYDRAAGVLTFDEGHAGSNNIVVAPGEVEAEKIATLMGTFANNVFTANPYNSVTGNINVASAFNADVTASTYAVIGASSVMLYDFEYTDDAEEAEASGGRLKYIPSLELPVYDRLNEMGYNPDGLAHGVFAAQWYDEGYPLYCWPNASLGYSGMKARVVSDAEGEQVRFGDHALRIDVDYSSFNLSSNSNNYLRVTDPTYFFEGSPKKIGAWVYVPEGFANFCIYLNCCDKNESIVSCSVSNVTESADGKVCENWVGWRYVEMDLTNSEGIYGASNIGPTHYPYGFYQGCGVFWISFQPGNGFGAKAAGTVYIDNIQLIYSSNTDDTKNPEVTSLTYDTNAAPEEFVNGETVLTDNTVTFRASYRDAEDKYMTGIDSEKVSMSIDGVDVTDKCYINEGDDEIYLYDAVLTDGLHSVSVTVFDNFGNKTIDTRYFTVDAGTPAAATFVAEQDNPILGTDYTIDVIAADASAVSGAEIAVHTFALFTSYYGSVSVEPAEGYALDGEPVYDSTNAIFRFKLVKDGEAVPADNVIARVTYAIPSDVPADSIEVTFRVDEGKLIYEPALDEKVLGSFSGRIDTSCIAPLILSSDVFLVGTEGGSFIVKDLDGEPVAGASIFLADGTAVSDAVTDADGKLFTDAFTGEVQKISAYAQKENLISFIYTTQSYASGGSEDGMPTDIVLNGAQDGSTMLNVSWFASPLASANSAVARYAAKADYEANGESAFREVEGISRIEELASSGNINTNYALTFNKVLITGLAPDTEYVYVVGDGEKMSELREFKTGKANVDTDFFIIGDMQDDDASNLNAILDALANSGTDYAFGLQTGDAVDNGGQYRWWTNVGATFSNGYLNTRPIVHVLGNHEYYGDYDGTNSADYFGMTLREDGTAPLAYSVTNGNVYMAVINYTDYPAVYQEAIEWVRTDAAASGARWKTLAIHQPAYYTNISGGNNGVHQMIPALVDEAGFDFVFSGHDHSYVRTYPVTGGERDDADGAVYYICGSTGEKSYEVHELEGFPYDIVRGSGALAGEYNAIYMTASTTDTTMTVDTHEITVNGEDYIDEIIDSYTMTKPVTCTEEGEHAYEYADGDLICSVCGYTRPLGDYTGIATDAETGKPLYFVNGALQSGWKEIDDEVYYFDENGQGATGTKRIDGYRYEFDDDGKLTVKPVVVLPDGTLRKNAWLTYGDDIYYLGEDGLPVTGNKKIRCENSYIKNGQEIFYENEYTYTFGADGRLTKGVLVPYTKSTGYKGYKYIIAGVAQRGWFEIDGDWYYFDYVHGNDGDGHPAANNLKPYANADGTYTITKIGVSRTFTFDEDCKLVRGFLQTTEEGTAYYWPVSQGTAVVKSLVEKVVGFADIDGATYYFNEDGYMVKGDSVTVDGKIYSFAADGKLIKGHSTEHAYVPEVVKGYAATCTETGLSDGTICAECGFEGEKLVKLDKIAHVDANGDGKCDMCGERTCRLDGQVHDGFFGALTRFFHNLYYYFRVVFGLNH